VANTTGEPDSTSTSDRAHGVDEISGVALVRKADQHVSCCSCSRQFVALSQMFLNGGQLDGV
jgi:hypothetical protein